MSTYVRKVNWPPRRRARDLGRTGRLARVPGRQTNRAGPPPAAAAARRLRRSGPDRRPAASRPSAAAGGSPRGLGRAGPPGHPLAPVSRPAAPARRLRPGAASSCCGRGPVRCKKRMIYFFLLNQQPHALEAHRGREASREMRCKAQKNCRTWRPRTCFLPLQLRRGPRRKARAAGAEGAPPGAAVDNPPASPGALVIDAAMGGAHVQKTARSGKEGRTAAGLCGVQRQRGQGNGDHRHLPARLQGLQPLLQGLPYVADERGADCCQLVQARHAPLQRLGWTDDHRNVWI